MKFMYNGIKGADGKLQKASYMVGPLGTKPEGMIRIYGKNYKSFSVEVKAVFKVEDGSDIQTDYFEDEHIDVMPSHPLYEEVKAAYNKQQAHRATTWAKRGPSHCFCGTFHVYGSCQVKAVA